MKKTKKEISTETPVEKTELKLSKKDPAKQVENPEEEATIEDVVEPYLLQI